MKNMEVTTASWERMSHKTLWYLKSFKTKKGVGEDQGAIENH